ncbi:MAG: hypothetical protein QOD41_776, partial [Cryptosporangiaceae bacterium]|nr:hypothetical protein [Cryptosporangiaceae bacterium]
RARGLPIRTPLTYVPADLEHEHDGLTSRLTGAGFDPDRPAIVAWLGVTMYLTAAAVASTLAALGGLAPGTEVAADYMRPAALRDTECQLYAEQVAAVCVWTSYGRYPGTRFGDAGHTTLRFHGRRAFIWESTTSAGCPAASDWRAQCAHDWDASGSPLPSPSSRA